MFKFSLSVRAYNMARRYGLPSFEVWAETPEAEMVETCRRAGLEVLANNRGTKTGVELLRAGGLGVYSIAGLVDGDRFSVDLIRKMCGRADTSLHSSLDQEGLCPSYSFTRIVSYLTN